jgi:S-adenosylmethionine decarboxylase
LIVELWGVSPERLTDEHAVEQILTKAAVDAGATVLHTHFHHFGEGYGITGVVVLQESHISIHTWPEMEYAALDLFMCGACNPNDSLPRILKAFDPEKVGTTEMLRGIVHSKGLTNVHQSS